MAFPHGSWTEFHWAPSLGCAEETVVSRNFCTTHPAACATDSPEPEATETGAADAAALLLAQDNPLGCKFCTRPLSRRSAAASRKPLNRCNQGAGRELQFLPEGVALILRMWV